MCFRINKEETKKLQAKKAPIIGFKSVAKVGDKLVSEYNPKFVYPKKGRVSVKSPRAVGNVLYSSDKAITAKSGIYFYIGKPDATVFENSSHVIFLSVQPSDILGANSNMAVAGSATVVKVVTFPPSLDTEKLWDELDKKKIELEESYYDKDKDIRVRRDLLLKEAFKEARSK